MRPIAAALLILPVLGALTIASAGQTQETRSYDAADLRLVRFVGEIDIRTGGVDRIEAIWEPGENLVEAPRFDVDGDWLEITQLNRRDVIDCRGRNNDVRIGVDGSSRRPAADYGRLVVRAPAGARVDIGGGAVFGAVGDVGALSLGLSSCSRLTSGDVAGDADVSINGSGRAEVGSVGGDLSAAVNGSGGLLTGAVGGGLDAAINGSGDVETGVVEHGVEAAINGSGDVRIASASGDIAVSISGSGDVFIGGGAAHDVEASIRGSGGLRFEGAAENVSLSAFGSGDVHVAEVSGDVRTNAFGSGRVHVGQGE